MCVLYLYLKDASPAPSRPLRARPVKLRDYSTRRLLFIITILSNYVLWLVLVVVCTSMFLFVKVFLESLHGD